MSCHLESHNVVEKNTEIKTETVEPEDPHGIVFSDPRCNGDAPEPNESDPSQQLTDST